MVRKRRSRSGTGPPRHTPLVELVYQYLPFDRSCEEWFRIKIEEAWIRELEEKLPAFQACWDEAARPLLETTVSEIGMPFRRREMVAVLSLGTPVSMSTPLLIGVRRFLDGPTGGKPLPMSLFAALVYHELLHGYFPYPLPGSEMMRKYENEPPMVRTHFHLMALLKHVYLRLNRAEELRAIVEKDSASENPAYRRAWTIVNEIDGHGAFVEELKAYAARAC